MSEDLAQQQLSTFTKNYNRGITMIETTTDFIPGKKIKNIIGVVRGNTIRSRGVAGHFVAGIESAFGGQITAYIKAMDEAREEAYKNMMNEAEKLKADAVI
ncbi:MAG: hypothetical protein COV47_03730, partial [Candidatus Diapherotrites archaeon CG11_big_fil_rev_8_21_14_0_20_37_9]